jgi:hypothetical protein
MILESLEKPRLKALRDHFADIEGPRGLWRVAHPLPEVLQLVVWHDLRLRRLRPDRGLGRGSRARAGKRAALLRFAMAVTAPLSVAGGGGRDEGRPGKISTTCGASTKQGDESGLTGRPGEDLGEVFVIEGGAFSAPFDALSCRRRCIRGRRRSSVRPPCGVRRGPCVGAKDLP